MSFLLDQCDYFFLVRALVYAEIKRLRKISDVFGDELHLSPAQHLDQHPLRVTAQEWPVVAARVAGFFGIPVDYFAPERPLASLGDWAQHVLDVLGPRPQHITFYTSGSTGEPKPIVRDYFFLEQDAVHLASMLPGTTRVVGLVPPHHIYGFIHVILIPKALRVPLLDHRFKRPAALIRALEPGDAIIGFPHIWRLCAETKERFCGAVSGVTSTGPCPSEIIRTLRRQGLHGMLEIYGSSESGAMGYRTSPDDPLTLMPTWKRLNGGQFVRETEDGGLSAPFEFQDELDWFDATRFVVKKRLDSAVQVAGTNVYPARVREILLTHEAVEDCAVRLMRPEEGDRLKAFVVPKPGVVADAALRDTLRVFLSTRVQRVEQPYAITFGAELPKNELGKLADWTIESKRVALTLDQALERLAADQHVVAADQDFVVDILTPEDAWGVARLFYAVHGPAFPFATYYLPDRLMEENRLGLVLSVVARTHGGDIVGYGSLFRSSAPHPQVYEIGSHVIHPAYPGTRVPLALQTFIRDRLILDRGVQEFFNEAPCHQVVTQKFGALAGFKETAIEIGLMPAAPYGPTDFPGDRVSMLVLFGRTVDVRQRLYLPEMYQQGLEFILEGLDLDRLVLPAAGTPPAGLSTRSTIEYFDFAQVARMHVLTLGEDFARAVSGFMEQAAHSGAKVFQVFLNLGEEWCAEGVSFLRTRGYFLGGLMPRWFNSDGLLMQRVVDMPAEASIKLYSQRAHRILDLVRRDIETNPACTTLVTRALAPPTADLLSCNAHEIDEVVLAGHGLRVEDVVAVARHGRPVRMTQDQSVLSSVEASASFIEWAVRTGEPIYGVNTGFGGMANVAIAAEDLCALQNNLVRFLNVCAGDYLPLEDVRAAMLLRANSHLRGASGVRRELIERLLLFLNHGVTPLVREMGSIGASGDLAPLASITGALIGADPCFQVSMRGETLSCTDALDRLGLQPLTLGPKEGLGMVNGTSVMTAIAANSLYDVRRLMSVIVGFHALVVQALRGSNQSFHPFIQELKPHRGQIEVARLLLAFLHGSSMCRDELDGHHESREGEPVQDRYSIRCLPQFLGPILDGVRLATESLEIEMNSANDNPLIDGATCLSLHGGNFLDQYVAVWMDHLRYYLGLTAKHMDAQIALLVTPEFSAGLPASLVGNTGRTVNMGLKGLQIAANAIMPLLSFYGTPIADRFPTHAEQFNQNINSQGFNAAVLARKSVRTMYNFLGIALLFGVQAVSLRAKLMTDSFDPRPLLSPRTSRMYEAVLTTLGREPQADRPLIWDDHEQSLEMYVHALAQDLAVQGRIGEAAGGVPMV